MMSYKSYWLFFESAFKTHGKNNPSLKTMIYPRYIMLFYSFYFSRWGKFLIYAKKWNGSIINENFIRSRVRGNSQMGTRAWTMWYVDQQRCFMLHSINFTPSCYRNWQVRKCKQKKNAQICLTLQVPMALFCAITIMLILCLFK